MQASLTELALLFLRLGSTSFGGPAVHIAMMEEEVVRRRGWMTREEFLDLVGASQLIPGPNSTELAIHVGYARAGWPGLLVAGACFIAPAMLIVWILAWAYVWYGTLPSAAALLGGIEPVVLAIVVHALWGLARTALHSAVTLGIAAVSLVAIWVGVHELWVLLAAALLAWIDWRLTRGGNLWEPEVRRSGAALSAPVTAGGAVSGGSISASLGGFSGLAATAAVTTFSLTKMFLAFLKAGALLFGSGYVLLAFLRNDFVTRTGWVSETELLDAIAVGQFTPGPLFTTATFVGYLMAGSTGAILATLGIFLPAFAFVALTAPFLHRLRGGPEARAVLGGLNAASLALMASVTMPLARHAFSSPVLATLLFAASLVLLVRLRMNSAWLVIGGGLIGLLLTPATARAQAVTTPAPVTAAAPDVGALQWIAGCWQQDRGTRTTQEQWSAPLGGIMLGTSRTVVANVAREFEFLRIAMSDGKLAYIAQPGGRPPTVFPVSVVGDSAVTFENLTHDFPQRIIYRRVGADSLLARVEGPGPNGTRGIDFPMKRVECGR